MGTEGWRDRHFGIWWEEKNNTPLEGSQVSPTRPSDKFRTKMKPLELRK